VLGVLASFRFHGELNYFLPFPNRDIEFKQEAGTTDTLKHVIESLGVPHTEIGLVTVNGVPRRLSDRLTTGDSVHVLPHSLPVHLDDPRFVLDGHLGRLAAYLRMLGFDTWYERSAEDEQLAAISHEEHRVLLTRDVGLLKRREIERGYSVRAHKPHDQLREITTRFALQRHLQPFVRCMACNGSLSCVTKDQVAEVLPPHTRETKNEFSRCNQCLKVYWRGTHYERMLGWINDLKAFMPAATGAHGP
jgi:uncharacterized protein with PIN domain